MLKIYFVKMSGAGNDFIFIDKNQNPFVNVSPELIKKLCDRRNGIGADGLVYFEDIENYDFKMRYFNADGFEGSLCGNGARCALKYAKKTGRLKTSNAEFISNGNEFKGEITDDDTIRFYLNPPAEFVLNSKINIGDWAINAHFADTGSPHLVIKIGEMVNRVNKELSFKNITDVPVYSLGSEIRSSSYYKPAGTNVNFVQIESGGIIIRTYERGVENETLACGTGAVAAALILNKTDNLIPPISLNTYGGDKLIVNFEKDNQKFSNISLSGPAKIIFEGSIKI